MSRSLAPSVLTVSLLLLTGCGDDPAEPTGSPQVTSTAETSTPTEPGEGEPAEECPAVVPDAVVEELGWPATATATEGRGGCAWIGEEGTIVVAERDEAYDAECERLVDAAPPATFMAEVDAEVTGCGYVREEPLGLSEWVVEIDDRVVSISIAAIAETEPTRVQSAMATLSATAGNV